MRSRTRPHAGFFKKPEKNLWQLPSFGIWLEPTFAPIEHVLRVLPSAKSPSLLIGSMDVAMARTGLKEGQTAYAVIKASDVMVGIDE